MTFWQWFGLIGSVLSVGIAGVVYRVDFWLWITGKMTISEGVWADLKKWRAGQGSFPKRALWIPALTSLSGIFLLIHFLG